MNDANIETVLASMAKTYESAPITERSPSSDKQTPKVKRVKMMEGSEIIPEKGPRRMLIQVPEKGSLTAREFLLAMNRTNDRNDMIRNIAGYVGYDPCKEFGEQEYWARNQAKKELSPIKEEKTPPSGKRVSATIRGYVAGMPNERAKKLNDLQGRLHLAMSMAAEHRTLAKQALSDSEKNYQETLAKVEEERASVIQREINLLPK
jgi:hypothetical protein